MKKIYIFFVLWIVCITVLSGCSAGLASLYGMRKIKPIGDKTIVRNSRRYGIPLRDSYELDTSYVTYLMTLDTAKYKVQVKNHYQPLQALYYDSTGQLSSFQINCYAGGFPNITWERNGIMDVFPPKQQAPLDSILPRERQLDFMKPISSSGQFTTDHLDYLVVVYWTRFMGRQSKRLVRVVQENSKLSTNKRIKTIYINADNIFVER